MYFYARLMLEVDAMNRNCLSFLLCLLIVSGSSLAAGANKQYVPTVDPQAVMVAQAAFNAMGGSQAVAGYQDSLSSGTVTIYSSGTPVSYPVTMKSKGLRRTRVELQMPKGTQVRIVNQGQGAMIRPDGSVKNLNSNNMFYEHVNHVPLLSVLAEYGNGNMNLLYKGTAQLQGQTENIIEIDFLPNLDPINGPIFASMGRTLFFVNKSTSLVDKIQTRPFYEDGDKDACIEETYFADYRSVNGLLIPFHQTDFINSSIETDFQLTTISFNVGLQDSEFTLPQTR
jgi:hypothetical protein